MNRAQAKRRPIVVAFSGGKDSTALTLRLHELGHPIRLIHTATGNELPGVREHVERVARETKAELIDLEAPTLGELIEEQRCLPNFRMRWCTRLIKIEPCAAWLMEHPEIVLAVGLRADEEGRAGGTFEGADLVYPLREWGWGEEQVVTYCATMGFMPPKRTDCAVCFYQTLSEWRALWENHREEFERGIAWEDFTGHTLRSPKRDTWPASLRLLAEEFAKGRTPKPRRRKTGCRICSM